MSIANLTILACLVLILLELVAIGILFLLVIGLAVFVRDTREAIKGLEEAFNCKLLGPDKTINIHEWSNRDKVWLVPFKKVTKNSKKPGT